MRNRAAALRALCAVSLAAAAAGCGSSDSSDAEPATAASTGADTRLSAASWADYEDVRQEAAAANEAATRTFATCRQALLSSVSQAKVKACLGTSAGDALAAGKRALTSLEGLEDETSGACAQAGTDQAGFVKLYVASVQALGNAVDGGNLIAAEAAIDDSVAALGRARSAAVAFERACRPAA